MKPEHELSKRGLLARRHKMEGRCTQCGQPAIPGETCCQPCRSRIRTLKRKDNPRKLGRPRQENAIDWKNIPWDLKTDVELSRSLGVSLPSVRYQRAKHVSVEERTERITTLITDAVMAVHPSHSRPHTFRAVKSVVAKILW